MFFDRLKSESTRILILLTIIVSFALLGVIIYNQIENNKKQIAIESQVVSQKELVDKILRSQSEYASKKDIEDFIKQNGVSLSAIESNLKKLGADVNSINVVLFGSVDQKGTNIPSTGLGPKNPNPTPPLCKDGSKCPSADPYGYLNQQQNLVLNEKFADTDVLFGTVGFSAWQPKPWSIDIKQREYHVVTVVGKDENQRSYFYNKVSINVDGKSYDVPITKAISKEEYPEAKWSWWNPRLYAGMDGGVGINPIKSEFTPSINTSIFSYGLFKNQPDFSILQLGAGFGITSRNGKMVITPVTYNLGKHIPLMNNLYVGPSLHLSLDGNVDIMFGARVGL